MTHVIVVGTTVPQVFQLFDESVPIDLTGITVDVAIEHLVDGVWTALADVLNATVLDATAGKVRVTGAGALAEASYLVRFKLTDTDGGVGYVPSGDAADVWRVVAVASR